ncbi:SpoIIE family protein phosphatase [Cellulomonas cellasea]|uniref:PAS domain-containing protein n=2 Tax=Cellulomonas cellasea TaxID=43670 RepID=A0A4Y3KSP6_9CELL|nr:SpoIIE family protein phosphatase [Cellulomonas cellasea]GEA87072.1 hypothetical protein CCE01nite_10210 [Cellulomonas cellasea]
MVAETLDPAPPGAGPDGATTTTPEAVRAARLGAFTWDVATGRVVLDASLARLLGLVDASAERPPLAEADVDPRAALRRVHPDDRTRLLRALLPADGTDVDVDVRLAPDGPGPDGPVGPDALDPGVPRWLQVRATLERDASGRASRVLGIAFDATRRDGLRTSALLDAMPTAFFSLDRAWRFTYANAAAETLLTRTGVDLRGGDLWELFPDAVGSAFETHYRAAVATGQPVAFEAYYPPPLDATYEVQAWPGSDGLAVYFEDVTNRRRTMAVAARETRRAALLASVTSQLAETLEAEQGVTRLAELLVPALGDWCVVTLVDHDHHGTWRGLKDAGCAHADPAARPVLERYVDLRLAQLEDTLALQRALESGQVVSATSGATEMIRANLRPGEARDLIDVLAPESGVMFALRGRGRTVGLVTLFNGAGRGPISADDLALAQDVGARAGLALDTMRLYHQQRTLAEVLQRSLLTAPVEPDHVQVAVRYVPAAEAAQVGGDWYDAFLQRGGATVVVIGDVVGHDVSAAASMGQIRSLLRGIAVTTGAGPAHVLTEVDAALATLRTDAIATAVAARIEQTPEQLAAGVRTLRWSNAGHPPPMRISPEGTVHPLVGTGSDLLLGVLPGTTRTESVVELEPGTTLLLYTDGLVERRDQPAELGIARLRATLARLADLDLEAVCDALLEELLPQRPQDDVALVAVRLHPQDRPRPPEAGPVVVPPGLPADPAAPADPDTEPDAAAPADPGAPSDPAAPADPARPREVAP